MPFFLTALLAGVAAVWVVQLSRAMRGMARLPRLGDFAPLPDDACPSISVLFGARDEAEKLPQALGTLLEMDYPRLEIVGVDDRSRDATPQILDEAARRDSRLKVAHVRELPAGWLGKPHALQRAYDLSTGEWLVFTDADVRFGPDLLRRAMALARARELDHLTLLVHVDMKGFWEKVAVSHWAFSFGFFLEPWRAAERASKRYVGVGAFQLLRRTAYETIGTHKRLALEVVDDMKLGKLIKQGNFRTACGTGEHWLRIRWQEGLGNIVRGLTKNSFAAVNYSVPTVIVGLSAMAALSILPFAALPLTSGWPQLFAAVAASAAVFGQGAAARQLGISPVFALTHPLGSLIMGYVILRSAVVTLWRGGVVWRDTFYPLDELRRGMV